MLEIASAMHRSRSGVRLQNTHAETGSATPTAALAFTDAHSARQSRELPARAPWRSSAPAECVSWRSRVWDVSAGRAASGVADLPGVCGDCIHWRLWRRAARCGERWISALSRGWMTGPHLSGQVIGDPVGEGRSSVVPWSYSTYRTWSLLMVTSTTRCGLVGVPGNGAANRMGAVGRSISCPLLVALSRWNPSARSGPVAYRVRSRRIACQNSSSGSSPAAAAGASSRAGSPRGAASVPPRPRPSGRSRCSRRIGGVGTAAPDHVGGGGGRAPVTVRSGWRGNRVGRFGKVGPMRSQADEDVARQDGELGDGGPAQVTFGHER